MEGDHFMQWEYQGHDGHPEYSETSTGHAGLNVPDSPGYPQMFGDRTSLPVSSRYPMAPSSPGIACGADPQDPYGHAPCTHHVDEEGWGKDELVRLAQAKVVLLGSVAAGKTSLLNTLRYGESRLVEAGPDGRTIGIEVHSVAVHPDTKLWFYDFGGHDTYHFSQQLFLTQRAIYLLAVDISIYDPIVFEKTLRHWYTILTSRLVTPVICLLATHIDLCQDREAMARHCQDMHDKLTQIEEMHRTTLENEFQMLKKEVMLDISDDVEKIRKFQPRTLRQPMQRLNLLLTNRPKVFHSVCCISSKTLEGINQFREELVSIVTENESLFPQKDVPSSWIQLSDAIVSKKDNTPFVTIAEFIDLAQQFNIVGDHVQKVLAYLQSVGLVLHYQDYRQNSDLSKYVFVNPNLLLAIFGLVFNHNYFMDETRFVWKHQSILRLPPFDFLHLRKNLKERGIIGEKLLKCFWDAMGISDEVYQAIVPLLEKFDLCYEIRIKPGDAVVEGRHFLFPYLLNKKKPQEVNFMWSDDLLDNFMQCGVELCFTQPSLPFGFLEKVLIRAHTYVDHCLSWKKGMVAFCDEGQDLVRIETQTDARGNAFLTLSARVRMDRKSMARHILLLLVAVTNRVLLHHYPGIVAYWYCQCAHCLVKSLEQKYSEVKIDHFPADNIVYTSPGDTTEIQCMNCTLGETLHLDEIFPRETEDIHNLKRLMSEPCCRALKSSAPALIKHMSYRDVMNALLRKQLLNIKQAEMIGSKSNHEDRAQQLLAFLTHSDQKAFEVLCDELMQNNETSWLAEELRVKSAGRNSSALKNKDSDSLSTSTLHGASAGWRGSQGSQGSATNTSISSWSSYSQTSYGATGSYIRRPYGSYITREPVQNYKRSSSTSSTPQQQRKEPSTVQRSRSSEPATSTTAALTKQADYVRKSTEMIETEERNLSEYEKKRLSRITEFPQEDLRNHASRSYSRYPPDVVPTEACEVEVATTAYVQRSIPHSYAPEPSNCGINVHHERIGQESNVDSYIAHQPPQPRPVEGQSESQLLDDEPDIDSFIEFKEPQKLVPTNLERGSKQMDYTQSSQYETDIDADLVPEYQHSNVVHHQQKMYQQEVPLAQNEHIHAQSRQQQQSRHQRISEPRQDQQEKQLPYQVYNQHQRSYQQPEQQVHQSAPSQEYRIQHDSHLAPQEPPPQLPLLPQQPSTQQSQQSLQQALQQSTNQQQPNQSTERAVQLSQEKQQLLEQTLPQPQQQPQYLHPKPQSQHQKNQGEEAVLLQNQVLSQDQQVQSEHQRRQEKEKPPQKIHHHELQHRAAPVEHTSFKRQPLHEYPLHKQLDQSGRPDDDQKLDPTSIIYKETDVDRPRDQHHMPRDVRVRSTGDILEHGSMPSQGRINDHLANGRGRPKSRSVVGLIGNADLGPTHVLQDMEPIELPLKPMKRSRSTSLNRSLRHSKSKSPIKVNEEDRPNTWAVPYDWEQHNSMESIHRACPSRQSGGFIFSASALNAQDSAKRQMHSPPIVYSSQPLLNADEGRYSMPRPTGKKSGTLPQHSYIEPIPLPEELIVAQSAPVQRRQPQFPPQGIRPAQNIIQGNPNGPMQSHGPYAAGGRPPNMNPEPGSRIGSMRQNLQGQILPNHPQVQQVRQSEKPYSSRHSDSSEATESYHTGRSRIGSSGSDDATITSDISELTIESFHTTRSHNPSIASKALSLGSIKSDRMPDSYRTGRSYANSDIPDDVTITSDVSELTIDSFHTFNSGMTATSGDITSLNNAGQPIVPQISNTTLNSFRSCALSDDEVTLTSEGSSSPAPFDIDNTPNKAPMRSSTVLPFSQPGFQKTPSNTNPQGPPFGPPSIPPPSPPRDQQEHYPITLESEENAPPVPPRKDLLNQAPPLPARPPNASQAERTRVTFADESDSQKELRVGHSASRVKQALTVPLPRTDPQWSPSGAKNKSDKKSKKKNEKKSKKSLLPYSGTTSDHENAVPLQKSNGQRQQQPQYSTQLDSAPFDNLLLNNNAPEMQKMLQNYVDLSDQQYTRGGSIRPPTNQEVYTAHAQAHPQMDSRQMSMRIDPRLSQNPQPAQGPADHSKPHAYVQPYMRGIKMQGQQWMDNNLNASNGNLPASGDNQGGVYPYKGGNGNGIVLVEEPYVSNREASVSGAPYQQPPALQHQSLRHPPPGGATGPRTSSRGGVADGGNIVTTHRVGGTQNPARRDGRSGQRDRNSTASSQDTPMYIPGSHDTAV